MGLFDKKNPASAEIAKVAALLKEVPDVEWVEDAPGNWGTRNNSVLVKVLVDVSNPDLPLVNVVAFTLMNFKEDLAIYKYLFTEVIPFIARWEIEEDEDGTLSLFLVHKLLIEDLDASELTAAVYSVALTADELDEDLQKRFGGKRCQDVFGWTD
jgi:hypothetical protein